VACGGQNEVRQTGGMYSGGDSYYWTVVKKRPILDEGDRSRHNLWRNQAFRAVRHQGYTVGLKFGDLAAAQRGAAALGLQVLRHLYGGISGWLSSLTTFTAAGSFVRNPDWPSTRNDARVN
jgi:hypothetical protein